MKKNFEQQVNQLIKEARDLSNTGIVEKDTMLTQAYRQIEIILKLNKLLDEKLFELTVINEIGNIIRSVEDYEEVMRSILSILKTILQYDIGGIALLEDNNQLDAYFNLTKKISSEEFIECKNTILNLQEWPSIIITESNIPHHIPKTENKEVISINKEIIMGQNNIIKNTKEFGIRKSLFYAVPLEIRSKIIGILFINNFDREITEHNKYTLNMVANQAILVINNCQLYHRMKDMAIHDGLTGLYNHRYFQASLEKEINRAGRHKGELYVMLLDIDYFKDYNDRYGHQKGDILLQEISKLFTINVRTVDLVARYGGEEFAIILPHTDRKGAFKVAERIREAIETYPFKGKDDKEVVHKTISIGLASYAKKKNKMDLIGYADNALYHAKHSGRNMIKIEEED
ncbi:sensor domain-containing diguanylate cyclase [Candidatus Poribacteria bacterium]|nr:sensor domain-containing diguanylate cyclase [Candidatus Poribacteria bacterium]